MDPDAASVLALDAASTMGRHRKRVAHYPGLDKFIICSSFLVMKCTMPLNLLNRLKAEHASGTRGCPMATSASGHHVMSHVVTYRPSRRCCTHLPHLRSSSATWGTLGCLWIWTLTLLLAFTTQQRPILLKGSQCIERALRYLSLFIKWCVRRCRVSRERVVQDEKCRNYVAECHRWPKYWMVTGKRSMSLDRSVLNSYCSVFFYVLDFPTGRRLPSRGSTRKGAVVTAFAISVSVQKSTFFALIFRLL